MCVPTLLWSPWHYSLILSLGDHVGNPSNACLNEMLCITGKMRRHSRTHQCNGQACIVSEYAGSAFGLKGYLCTSSCCWCLLLSVWPCKYHDNTLNPNNIKRACIQDGWGHSSQQVLIDCICSTNEDRDANLPWDWFRQTKVHGRHLQNRDASIPSHTLMSKAKVLAPKLTVTDSFRLHCTHQKLTSCVAYIKASLSNHLYRLKTWTLHDGIYQPETTVISWCKDTLHKDNLDVRAKELGTSHCILTAMVLLSKDNMM